MCHLRAAKLIHFSPRNRPLFSFCAESRGLKATQGRFTRERRSAVKIFFARDLLLALISRSPDKAKEGFVLLATKNVYRKTTKI